MSRLADGPKPEATLAESPTFIEDWGTLAQLRQSLDEGIVALRTPSTTALLPGIYTGFPGRCTRDIATPRWLAVVHFFNHQTITGVKRMP